MSSPGRPSTSSIDIGSLEADLSRFRSQLDQWADQLVSRTTAEKDAHVRELGQLAGASLRACVLPCSFSNDTHSVRSANTRIMQMKSKGSNGSTRA